MQQEKYPSKQHFGRTHMTADEKSLVEMLLRGETIESAASFMSITVDDARRMCRRGPLLDKLLSEYATIGFRWTQLVEESKNAIAAALKDDQKIHIRLNAAKLCLDTLSKISPVLVRDSDRSKGADLERLAAEVLGVTPVDAGGDGEAN